MQILRFPNSQSHPEFDTFFFLFFTKEIITFLDTCTNFLTSTFFLFPKELCVVPCEKYQKYKTKIDDHSEKKPPWSAKNTY